MKNTELKKNLEIAKEELRLLTKYLKAGLSIKAARKCAYDESWGHNDK